MVRNPAETARKIKIALEQLLDQNNSSVKETKNDAINSIGKENQANQKYNTPPPIGESHE